MRRRFFVDQVHSGHAEISGEEARHLTRVLRVEAGQQYEISDDRSVYLAEVETARKEHVVFRVKEKVEPSPLPVRIMICAALIKFDHFEWLIEKATELGVARITPFMAVRSEKGLDRAAGKRVERWRRIAIEASQQSRRDHLPEIDEPIPFADVLSMPVTHRFVLEEQAGAEPLVRCVPTQRSPEDSVAVLVGPEGGWTDTERERFGLTGWKPVTLGPTILRAETAALAALSVLTNLWLVH